MGRSGEAFADAEQDKDLATIGGRIRYARKLRMMTQEELARRFPGKKGRAVISEYEQGNIKPSLDVIETLATILEEDPAYLAFGVLPGRLAQAVSGKLIPTSDAKSFCEDQEQAVLPTQLLADLGAGGGALRFVKIVVDAPAHGFAVGDYALVDTSVGQLKPDGRLFAIDTSAGLAVMRSEPALQSASEGELYLVSGRNVVHPIKREAVAALGVVVASLQRSR